MTTATSTSNSPAIAGFVCSLLGIVLFFMIFPPVILGSAGIILGRKGRALAQRGADHGTLATGAVVLGIIAVVFFAVELLLFLGLMLPASGGGVRMIEVGTPVPVE
jgi:hypothetical protein